MDAHITLSQLSRGRGIGALVAMLGAHSFVRGDDEVHFQFRGSRKANRVSITLEPSDTYTLRFYAGRGVNIRKVHEFSDVYCDRLADLFEEFTGLYVTLR